MRRDCASSAPSCATASRSRPRRWPTRTAASMSETAPMAEPMTDKTAGALLREARIAQGMHIAAMSAAIKVAQRKLELLEADRYDELPDATFTRALAQTMCRVLKVDAEPVLSNLQHRPRPWRPCLPPSPLPPQAHPSALQRCRCARARPRGCR